MLSSYFTLSLVVLLVIFAVIIFIYIKKCNKLNNDLSNINDNISHINNNTATMEMNERLEYTKKLLEFIDKLIMDELINQKRFEIFTKKHDKNLDFDKVIEEMSTNVFNSLKKDIFLEPNVIITEEYLIRYIQKKTFITYFSYIEHNVSSQL